MVCEVDRRIDGMTKHNHRDFVTIANYRFPAWRRKFLGSSVRENKPEAFRIVAFEQAVRGTGINRCE